MRKTQAGIETFVRLCKMIMPFLVETRAYLKRIVEQGGVRCREGHAFENPDFSKIKIFIKERHRINILTNLCFSKSRQPMKEDTKTLRAPPALSTK